MEDEPIVILAVPRSGSQLLRALLNAHPSVLISGYSDILDQMARPALGMETIERLLREEYAETFRGQEHLLAFLRATWKNFWTLTGEAEALDKSHVERWGFINYDAPGESAFVKLSDLFPEARYVHMVRDGRNVVASFLANWSVAAAYMPVVRQDPAEIAALWVRTVRAARTYRAHTIRLEDLHHSATRARSIAALQTYCGIENDGAVNAFANALPWVNAQKHTVERWRQDLSAASLEAMMAVEGFAQELQAYGYSV